MELRASWPPCASALHACGHRHQRASMAEPVLRVERAFKRFGGLLAVDNASLAVEAGRITALIGPNRAGKTTLFSIISGFMPPSERHIFYPRAHITAIPPHLAPRPAIPPTSHI